MAMSPRTSWGGLKVIYLVVNEPGGLRQLRPTRATSIAYPVFVAGKRLWLALSSARVPSSSLPFFHFFLHSNYRRSFRIQFS